MTRPRGRPSKGPDAATERLTIRLRPVDRDRLQAVADAEGEPAATVAQRGLLAWLAGRIG